MIWTKGRILPDEDLAIGVADRALEHGLGLFETLRTRSGVPEDLDRHLARMTRSAEALGIPLEPADLPDLDAAARLVRANGIAGEARIRITLTGGISEGSGSVLWMRCAPLPPAEPKGAVVVLAPWPVAYEDPLARHKGLNYWARRLAHEGAARLGADEALFASPDGRIWEGSRTNLFLVRGARLETPGLDGPIVPGIMRGRVLERARAIGMEAIERDLDRADLESADEVFLTNSVRGIVPVAEALGTSYAAPGPLTSRLIRAMDEESAEGRGATP